MESSHLTNVTNLVISLKSCLFCFCFSDSITQSGDAEQDANVRHQLLSTR